MAGVAMTATLSCSFHRTAGFRAGSMPIIGVVGYFCLKIEIAKKHYSKESDIYPIPCPGLADYVENGILDGEEITAFIRDLLAPALEHNIDAIVLGCTHYPFVERVIQRIAGPDVKIFNGAHGTALELQRRLRISELLTPASSKGTVEFISSNPDPNIIRLCHQLFNA